MVCLSYNSGQLLMNVPAQFAPARDTRQSEVNAMSDSIIPPLKRCSKCRNEFPATLEYFYKLKTGKHGLCAQCKSCIDARSKAYWLAHPGRRRAIQAKYYANHADEKNQHDAQWRAEHPERAKEIQAQYRQSHPDRIIASRAKWRAMHPDERKAHARKWSAANREYTKLNTHRHRTRKISLPAQYSLDDWNRALVYFNGTCAYCQNPPSLFDHYPTLHADHFIPLNDPTCPGTVKWNIVPACQSCNISKSDHDPIEWILSKFGPKKAKQIIRRIQEYLTHERDDDEPPTRAPVYVGGNGTHEHDD